MSNNVLVFLEQNDGNLPKAALAAVTAAEQLKTVWGKGDLVGLCVGAGAAQAASTAAKYGLSKVYACEAPEVEKYLAGPYADAVCAAFEQSACDCVVAAATSTGKDLFARVTARLDAAQASDVIEVIDNGALKRPMYAGNVFAEVELDAEVKVVTVRATAFAPAGENGAGQVESLSASFSADYGEVVSYDMPESERPELADAEVVVSGGRALKSEEECMKYTSMLADELGAAIGASRAAVDSGYAPNDWQVGQTGKVVAPNLYFALGISGAIQHVAGMKDSKVIVAINKDAEAPIFEMADYGLVADLFEAIPALVEEIKKAKS